MYNENFKRERIVKQIYMMIFGVFAINVGFAIKKVLDEDRYEK